MQAVNFFIISIGSAVFSLFFSFMAVVVTVSHVLTYSCCSEYFKKDY